MNFLSVCMICSGLFWYEPLYYSVKMFVATLFNYEFNCEAFYEVIKKFC
jgi:hypothetical protein